MILAGRQGNDSDNGQVPAILSVLKDCACSFAKIERQDDKVVIECEAEGGDATYEPHTQ